MMPIVSAAKRLDDAPVSGTLTGAQRLDIIMLLKEHASAAAQRAKKQEKKDGHL